MPPPLLHSILQFVSDFVFAFVLCVVYRLASKGWDGSKMELAFLCATIVWLDGVPMTYLGLVNGGYLPVGVSIATALLALATFFVVAPLLPWLLRACDETGAKQLRACRHSHLTRLLK
jgi:hypothetical protein